MENLAAALGAYNQLTPIHLIGFIAITVVVARPEWLGLLWKRISGNGRGKPAANGWATKHDISALNSRLDSHEAECVKRNEVIQRDIDDLKNDVAELKHDSAALKNDVGNIRASIAAMRTDIKWIGKTLGYRNSNNEEFPDA